MTHIDNLLVNIVKHNTRELEALVPPRDANVLKSLNNSIVGQYFITENQSKLLVKILQENHKHFPELSGDIVTALAAPTWSRPFRQIEQVKKLYISHSDPDNLSLIVEFTFSAHIRKILTQANRQIHNLVQSANGRMYFAELTEQNIVTLVELLRPLDFEIDELVQNHYTTIKSWTEQSIKDQFLLTAITNQNFIKHITNDLGISTELDKNIIQDRSVRYRYSSGENLEPDGTLVRGIATRKNSKLWINNKTHSLSDVIKSLVELKRLPIMVVFDNHAEDKMTDTMLTLSNALEENNVDDAVGIYFRMPNTESGKQFNTIISDKKYNQYLGPDTKVVGVQSGKIPKFFLTSNWKPMSVIAIDHQLRSSKTAVYASCCDLIVMYTDTPPIVEKNETWL